MIDKKSNNLLKKGLKNKTRKPSFFARYNRKKIVSKITSVLKAEGVEHLWLHEDFVSAQEKKPKTIVAYVDFGKQDSETIAHSVDGRMDKHFPKHSLNIINVRTLLPSIKESIFKELTQIY